MILKLHREEERLIGLGMLGKEEEMQRTSVKEKMAGAFLEENMINSMQHKEQSGGGPRIVDLETAQALEAFGLLFLDVGPRLKSVKEANMHVGPWSLSNMQDVGYYSGLEKQNHKPTEVVPWCKELDVGDEQSSSGQAIPPGFEDFVAAGGPSNQLRKQDGVLGTNVLETMLEEGNHSSEGSEFSSSVEKVLQYPLIESNPNWNSDEAAMPDEDDVVEAQITWDIGKTLGLQAINEKAVVDALAKI